MQLKVVKVAVEKVVLGLSQSPYGARWFATEGKKAEVETPVVSQSPYGARWFATRHLRADRDGHV